MLRNKYLWVILYNVNVVFCKGWVGLAHRILLKDIFVRFAKSYVRRCLGSGQGSCVVGLGDLQRSVPTQTTLMLSLYVNLCPVLWVPHSGPFMSPGKRRATLTAVFLMLFEENWVVLGLSLFAWVVGFYLFIHLLICSLIYLLSSRLRQDWRQFALLVFNHK